VTTIGISDGRPKEPRRLRGLAAWYRALAEGAGNPVIWEARLRTAAELEREADQLEEEFVRQAEANPQIPPDPRENSRINFFGSEKIARIMVKNPDNSDG
jgi:hypothetical protein